MTFLQYIESSGSQWIDTLFTPNQDTKVEIKYYAKSSGAPSYFNVLGARQSSNSREFEFQQDGNNFYVGFGGTMRSVATFAFDVDTIAILDKGTVYLNGDQKTTITSSSFTAPSSLLIFALHHGSNVQHLSSGLRVYYCKIWDNGTLVRDFVPVTDESDVICLYDKVSDAYYYNQGSGTFIAGPSYYIDKSELLNLAMTSNTYTNAEGHTFIASASTTFDAPRQPYKPFDGTGATGGNDCWHPTSGVPQWLQLQISSPCKINAFTIKNRSTNIEKPTAFTFQGSNDGTTWDDLGIISWPGAESGMSLDVTIPSYSNYYTYFRWYITAVTYSPYAVIAKIIFTDVDVPGSSYTVQYNSNGGTGIMSNQNIEEGVATALRKNTYTNEGYTFAGWDTSSAGTTVVYDDEEVVTDLTSTGETITLYAVWELAWGYLLKDDNNHYYTMDASQNLTQISVSSLTKAVFLQYGFQTVPLKATLTSLSNPTIYKWDGSQSPQLNVSMMAIPYPQPIKTVVDFSGQQIIGIQNLEAEYSGNVNVQYSYNDSTYTTQTSLASFLAMDKDTLYNGLSSNKMLYIKFILMDENATLTRFKLTYKRRSFE